MVAPSLATITGTISLDQGMTTTGGPVTRAAVGLIVQFSPGALDTSAIPTTGVVVGVISATGTLTGTDGGPLLLWPGTWTATANGVPGMPFTFTVTAGQTADLYDLRGYVAPPNTTVQTVNISGASVTTLAAGSAATAGISGGVLDLGIPQGATGSAGPANTLTIGSVTTVAAGGSASATITGTAPNQTLSLGLVTGQPSAYELRGTGSPYGSVTPASAGIYYTDTAGTNGAWRWMSTGTTNTSWVVTVGDTGWLSLPLTGNVSGFSGTLLFCRVGGMCELKADNFSIVAPGAGTISNSIPSLGQPEGQIYIGRANGPNMGTVVYQAWNTTLTLYNGAITSGLYFKFLWTTTNPWPTVLPGTPA